MRKLIVRIIKTKGITKIRVAASFSGIAKLNRNKYARVIEAKHITRSIIKTIQRGVFFSRKAIVEIFHNLPGKF